MASKKASALLNELKEINLMDALGEHIDIFDTPKLVDYSYLTGVSILDYFLGYEVIIRDAEKKEIGRRTVLGIQAGSFNVFTGATQTFKTSIGEQICANIAYAYDGNIIHYDAENRAVKQRIKNLTKLPDDWFNSEKPRYLIKHGGIGYDTIKNDVTNIYTSKMKHKDFLLKDTGEVDDLNRPILLMPPTILFIDSITDVIQNEIDAEDKKQIEALKDLRSNTAGMINAKTLRGLLVDILPMMKEANIIINTISHMNTNPGMPGQGVSKQFQYGSFDKKISGGKALEYGASLLATFTARNSEDSRFHVTSDGFEGNTVLCEPTKSSTNESGNEKSGLSFELVFDKRDRGVDNVRSLILFLNSKGRLRGNKAGYRVIDKDGNDLSERFSWRHVYEDFEKSPETAKVFFNAAVEELKVYISKANDKKIEVFNLNKMI